MANTESALNAEINKNDVKMLSKIENKSKVFFYTKIN